MAIWSNWFGNNSKVEQPPKETLSLYNLNQQSKVLDYEPLSWYKQNPFFFSAINERAKACSSAMFYIETPDGEEIENELTVKLNKPNDFQSGEDWKKQLITFLSIWGTGYMYSTKPLPSRSMIDYPFINIPTNRIEFEGLEDMYMSILKGLDIEPKVWYKSDQEKKLLNIDNLIPIFDTTQYTNLYFSESRAKGLVYAVSNTQAAFESQNTFLSNPGGMGMIVKKAKEGFNPVLTEDERKELEKTFQRDYGTLQGQNNIHIAGTDVDFISMMADVSKLELNPTLVQNGLIIYGAYDLPKEAFTSLVQGSTFENQKEAYKRYLQTSALELVSNIASSLDRYEPSKEGKLKATFKHLPIMQEDEKLKAEVKKTEADALKIEVEVWDKWLQAGYINENDYKQNFGI